MVFLFDRCCDNVSQTDVIVKKEPRDSLDSSVADPTTFTTGSNIDAEVSATG